MHQNFANQPLWNDHNHTVRTSIDHLFQVPLIANRVVPLLIARELANHGELYLLLVRSLILSYCYCSLVAIRFYVSHYPIRRLILH